MRTVKLRGVEIGAGAPKVVVPIVGRTREAILAQADELAALRPDMAEWRADYCDDRLDESVLTETLRALRGALGEMPLIFTFRTAPQGGEKPLAPEEYTALNIAAARSGCADAVDFELAAGEDWARRGFDAVHAAGVAVIGSSHDFAETPPKEELIARFRRMQELGADILKIAVMPRSRADVLALLAAAEETTRLWADRPVAAISMSPLGIASRLCGEAFGSALTFGAAGETSAPGQLPVGQLKTVTAIVHDALKNQKADA